MFHDSEHEVWYGEVRMQPLLFQDDVMRVSEGQLEAQVGNNLMDMVTESKLLTFNHSKSAYVIIGGGKENKKKLLNELNSSPLTLSGKVMKQAKEYVYLGTVISEAGVSQSAALSVSRKTGKVKQLTYEIKAVIGVFCTAVCIWEMSVIPHLHN